MYVMSGGSRHGKRTLNIHVYDMCGGSRHGKRTLNIHVHDMCGGSRHGKRTLNIHVYDICGGSRHSKRTLIGQNICDRVLSVLTSTIVSSLTRSTRQTWADDRSNISQNVQKYVNIPELLLLRLLLTIIWSNTFKLAQPCLVLVE